MPDKIAERSEVNGRPVPEKIEETTRRYIREAGTASEDAFRMYNDMMATTTEFYFDMFEKTMHDSMEITTRAEHPMEDMMTMYRKTYTEGFKAWQAYWQDLNKLLPRPK